ncbi:MAG: hypothetical protein ACRC8A_12450 [Microcoleaceae cyanobacterium]
MDRTNFVSEQQSPSWHLFVYLVPVIGFFPALWTLYRSQGNSQERATSRLVVTLALGWLLGNLLLGLGAQTAESAELPFLLTSSVLTTSYFISCFGLMVRVWRRQPLWLPGVSQVSERMIGKHLS